MARAPREVGGFIALPVVFAATKVYPTECKHYIYIKPHDPKIPTPDTLSSLFLSNLPVSTDELHIKHLFGTQLSAGRVERVEFSDQPTRTFELANPSDAAKKRKRVTAEDLQNKLDSHELPGIWQGTLHASGAHAVVVFIDRPSMEASLKAARRRTKGHVDIIWGDGIKDRLPPQGLRRYQIHNKLKYPSRKELLNSVDEYMSAYAQMEEARSREAAKTRQVPDDDGFVTVTKGAVRKEEAKELAERAKEKEQKKTKSLDNFYRFQNRGREREEHDELMRKFENDKIQIAEMKNKRRQME